jgi:hypothetical protein
MDGQDQWRALFVLQFNRDPPNIFSAVSQRDDTIDTMDPSQGVDDASQLAVQAPLDIANDSSGVYGLTDSFFDQAMDFDLALPGDSTESATPLLDMNEFLVPEPAPQHLEESNNHEASAISAGRNAQPQGKQENPSMSVDGGLVTLEQKVTALEAIISAQTNKDKDRIFSLQEKVVQLEQKLFQSSEREQQLEATLGVIFDALQRTGDSRAQPNKALWNLVMSHSSQAIGSVTGTSERNEGKREKPSPEGFFPISPTLTFKTSAQTPPDSAYGSIR